MTILIADDNVPIRRIIRNLIESSGDKVFECADGFEAVEIYRKHQPEWVLMDVRMPRMDGIAATKAIRLLNPQAKIIVVTSYDDPVLSEEVRQIGAIDCIVKDDLSRLRTIIK